MSHAITESAAILQLREAALMAAEQWAERAEWDAQNKGAGGPGCEAEVDALCNKTYAAIVALANAATAQPVPGPILSDERIAELWNSTEKAWLRTIRSALDPKFVEVGQPIPAKDDHTLYLFQEPQ